VRIVLDTAVIVAGTRSGAGASRQLLLAALERRFELLLSVPLTLEYEAVLKRPQHLAASGATIREIE
jgi:predicted nucleic acid-binding protein